MFLDMRHPPGDFQQGEPGQILDSQARKAGSALEEGRTGRNPETVVQLQHPIHPEAQPSRTDVDEGTRHP